MVLDDFIRNLKTIQQLIGETNFVALIKSFADIAANAKSGSQQNWKEELNVRFEEIDTLLVSFEADHQIILEENGVLKRTEAGSEILNYRDFIEELFTNIITADVNVQALATQFEQLGNYSSQMLQLFTGLGIDASELDIEDNLNLVTFEFKHSADLSNLKLLGDASTRMDKHLKALAKLDPSSPPKDIIIATASKSSPFIVTAWVSKQVAKALNKIVSDSLDNAKKVQELRYMEQDIQSKKLDNADKSVQNALNAARADLEKNMIKKITEELMGIQPEATPNGARNELEKGTEDAVEYFVTQTSKGLEIRVLPAQSDLSDSKKARKTIQEYRSVIKNIELLHNYLPAGEVKPRKKRSN